MLSHWKQDKTRHRHIPKFHRNSLWQHADLDDHDRNHATSSCSREPEQPLFQAMPFRRRDSSPDHDATPLRRVHPPDSLEASRLDFILTFRRQYLTDAPIGQDVQFRKLILPGSDSYDGTTELSSQQLTRASANEPFQSRGSDTSLWISSTGWNVSKLLELSDTIRVALNDGKDIKPTELGSLTFVLGMMLADETDDAPQSESHRASQKVDISTVQRSRFDKLLADITLADEKGADEESKSKFAATGLWAEIETARSLQKSWRARFKNEYFALDRRRCDDLIAGGLRDILFSNVSGGRDDLPQKAVVLSEQEMLAYFVPGQWWFNLDCAYRDGLVDSSVERLTTSRTGIAALPLLTGWEEDLPDGRTEYIRRGGQRDMQYGLVTQVGRSTKLIRGFRLKSVYAPQAGIRYDGLYNITSWSIKLCPCTDLYTLKVVLERLPRQKAMGEVLQTPKPSQLDDWAWYEKFEKEAIKQREGAVRLSDWQAARAKDITERDYWHKVRELKGEMVRNGEAGGGPGPPGLRQTQWPYRDKKPGIGTHLGTPEWPRK